MVNQLNALTLKKKYLWLM